jgi:hypothetical protein
MRHHCKIEILTTSSSNTPPRCKKVLRRVEIPCHDGFYISLIISGSTLFTARD